MKAGVDFVVEEEGEDTKEIGTGGIGMKAGVDFVVDEEVEDTEVVETMTGEDSDVTVSEPKPTDSENPTSQPRVVGLVSPGRICMPGAPTWTKKWTFEHFVKRRRRKLWLSCSPVLRFHF